jgi:hypothetical protein
VLNNPLKLVDPYGLVDDDPQDPKKKDPQPSQTPLPKVTVIKSTDPGVTITITDPSGKPLEGLTVTETNRVIEAEPALPFEENKSTVTTDANGSFTDIVFGNATTTSKKVSPEEATQIVQKQIESRVKVVTEQTLTIAGPNKEILATAVYQRTITNLDEQGNRRPAFDSSGRRHVNNFSITVGSVTVSRPSSP